MVGSVGLVVGRVIRNFFLENSQVTTGYLGLNTKTPGSPGFAMNVTLKHYKNMWITRVSMEVRNDR